MGNPPSGEPMGTPPSGASSDMGNPPSGEPGGMGGGQSGQPESYSAVKTVSEDAELSDETIKSTGTDENALLVTGGNVTLDRAMIARASSDSTGGDASSFYGVGAAVLATAARFRSPMQAFRPTRTAAQAHSLTATARLKSAIPRLRPKRTLPAAFTSQAARFMRAI